MKLWLGDVMCILPLALKRLSGHIIILCCVVSGRWPVFKDCFSLHPHSSTLTLTSFLDPRALSNNVYRADLCTGQCECVKALPYLTEKSYVIVNKDDD